MIYQGTDAAFATCNMPRLKTLLAEILVDVRRWSVSVAVRWSQDRKMLRAPAIKIEFEFQQFAPHPFLSLVAKRRPRVVHCRGDRAGRDGLHGNQAGKPASLRLWLPATLPDHF